MSGTFQTRNEDGAINYFNTLTEAMKHAKEDDLSVWKISFGLTETGERVRLVRHDETWVYEPISE